MATVRVEGRLDFGQVRHMYDRLVRIISDPTCAGVRLDLARLGGLDSAGVALLSYVQKLAEGSGKTFELLHLPPAFTAHFKLVPVVPGSGFQASRKPDQGWTERTRNIGEKAGRTLLDLATMTIDAGRHALTIGLGRSPSRMQSLVEQCIVIGVHAVPIVALLSGLVGVVLAFQGVYQLERFGADMFVAEIVSLGMAREFGPLITAIIMAGRTGAAISAELGTMSVREELDALRALGIEPTSLLVAPRMIAITLAGPTLTFLSIAVGIGAGIAVAGVLDLPPRAVFLRMRDALVADDFLLGFVKSLLFAWLIGLIGCFFGLGTRGGPTSVGRNTTRSVVVGIFSIVVVDSAVTTLWTLGRNV